uniref:Uncharacterized protein n=1 Tax=Chromera velia CCMP2878 TaxID=1169474 RepID=A0A0G4HQF7_9ALVE|eukprot:Cvel_7980.t1-p1 / transcript=Cvel_7980.t1 / gene=Cvel_7980 / organism=Chromera_velia_CCMP2878 / gene_product=hypothetical protein / transcript_product=hypothetical protein / location=Cvel_scaffold429:69174-70535(-) / protein_length=317 / sequence_SO=supercontig / SO=protein_coding / is_pseudo=false
MRRPEYGARKALKEIPGHWVARGRALFDLCKDKFNEFHDSLNWLSYRLCVSNGLKYFALKYRVLSLATYQTDILTGFFGPHYVWGRVVLGLGKVDASAEQDDILKEVICGVDPMFDVTDERMRALLTTNYNPEEEVTSEEEGVEEGGGKKRKLKKRQPQNDAKRRKAVECLLKMEAVQFRTAMERPCVVHLRGKAIQGVLPGLQVNAVFNRWFGVEGGVARRLLRPSIYMLFSSSRVGSASLHLVYDVPDNPAAMEQMTFVASSSSSTIPAPAAAATAGVGVLQVAWSGPPLPFQPSAPAEDSADDGQDKVYFDFDV